MEKEKTKLPVYYLDVNECENGTCDGTGVNYISIVNDPAIKVDFYQFSSNQKKNFRFKIHNAKEQKLIGPLMIPEKPIYRKNPDTGEEYFVKFSTSSIENCQKNFIKNQLNKNIDTEHNNVKLSSAVLLENWIVKNPVQDKSKFFGFDAEPGTWFGVVYISDPEEFDNYITSGNLNGFSVEGGFEFGEKVAEIEIEKFKKQDNIQSFSSEELEIIEKISNILLKNNNLF